MKCTLLALTASVLLISCDKDDATDVSLLPGEWKLYEIYTNDGVSTTTVLGEDFVTNYEFFGKDISIVTTFNEDPNTFTSTGTYTAVTTFEGFDPIESVVTPYNLPSEWEISGDLLIQTIAGQVTELHILELSDTKLRLRFDQDVTLNNGGVLTNDKATVYSSYERL